MRWRVWLIFLTFPLFSAELEERVTTLEKEMGEVSTVTPEGHYGASFAPENFQRGWIGLFFSGSALYWDVKVAEDSGNKGWGYRLGAGVRLPILRWELVGIYTHFKATPIEYDTIDLELRSSSFLSRFFGMGTYIGVRKGWIDLNKSSFEGIGPRLGAHLDWHLIYGLSFLADGSLSLLYGRHDQHRNFSANLGYFLGAGWNLYGTWYHFGISIGYEVEHYWRQNRSFLLRPLSNADDITLYGVTFRALMEF